VSKLGFAENLKAEREARGLTQQQLADGVGVTQGLVAQWENNQRTPSLKVAIRLARSLGVTVDGLLSPDELAAKVPPTPLKAVRVKRNPRDGDE
jgi:transcriptional regulator with XRE-family HTH domain